MRPTTTAVLLGSALALASLIRASAAEAPGAAEAVRALIEGARQADLAGDRAFYERVLAKDFTLGTSTGEWETRESKLAYLGSTRHKVHAESISDLKIRAYTASAVATFKVQIDGEWEGKGFKVAAIVTQHWVLEGGRWLLAATHGSKAL